jgi:two-component system cell cycle sensor histidine kinase/response regulator CckA
MTGTVANNDYHPAALEAPGTSVLLVDDEENLRTLIRRSLQSQGYGVLEAGNGAEALLVLKQKGQVDLVVTDLRMPVMDGRQLASALTRLYPAMPVIFMSGFTAQLTNMRLVSPHMAFIVKPFRYDDLLALIKQQLESRTS